MSKSKGSKSVAILGGGYTGLMAAYRLSKAGYDVSLFEMNKSLGGLASDFKVEGASLERAYHHLFNTDKDIISATKELGIEDKLKWHESSLALYYDNALYSFKGALDLLRFKPLSFLDRIRAGLVVLYLQKLNNWKPLQKKTAYDWMLKASGPNVTKVIWGPLLKGKFHRYYDKVSMAWLWARIHIRAQSREKGGEKLGYFEGGFQTFTDALVAKLEGQGVKISTGVGAKQITSLKDDTVELVTSSGKSEIFDYCIATVPSGVFAKLTEKQLPGLDASYASKLTKVDYLSARLLVFSSDQELSEYYWHNINDTRLSFLVFINHTRLISKEEYNGKYVYYIATYAPKEDAIITMSNEDLQKKWLKELTVVFPEFDQNKISEIHPFVFHNAQHIVDTDYASNIPDRKTPLENVFLSNFAQIYPEDRGTNYAIREGNKIAGLVIERNNKK